MASFTLRKTELFSVHELKAETNSKSKDERPHTSKVQASADSTSFSDLSTTAGAVFAGGAAQLWQLDKAFFPSASDGADNAGEDENLSEASASIIRQIEQSRANATTLPNDTIEVSFRCYAYRNAGLQYALLQYTQLVFSRGLANVSILV